MARKRFLLQVCFVVLGCVAGLALFVIPDAMMVRGLVALVFGVFVLFWLGRFLSMDDGPSRGHCVEQLTQGPARSVPDLARDYYADVRFVAVLLGLTAYAALDFGSMIWFWDAALGWPVVAEMQIYFTAVGADPVFRVDPLGHQFLWQIALYGVFGAAFVLSYWTSRTCPDVRRFFVPMLVVFGGMALWFAGHAQWMIDVDVFYAARVFGIGGLNADFLAAQAFSDVYEQVGLVARLQAVGFVGVLVLAAACLFVAVHLARDYAGLWGRILCGFVVLVVVLGLETLAVYSASLQGLYVLCFMVWGMVLGSVYRPKRKSYRAYK